MSTGIEWTDETWNPVVGCTKVSQGCKNCYAKTLHDRRHKAHLAGKNVLPQYAVPFEQVQLMPARVYKPLSWAKPRRVFVNSVSDLFHEDVPFSFIDEVFEVMRRTKRHTFQVLTKRPARMLEWALSTNARFGDILGAHVGEEPRLLRNVWLGVSVENQAAADERIPLLLQMPAAIRWLSCEPLLGPIDLTPWLWGRAKPCDDCPKDVDCACGYETRQWLGEATIDWVVAGGESGAKARPMHPDWARGLRDQCHEAGVSFFFKQWGEWKPVLHQSPQHWTLIDSCDGRYAPQPMQRVGKKHAGRELDGRTWDGYPEKDF